MIRNLSIAVMVAWGLSFGSRADSQVIPRIRSTRPCLAAGIPAGNYATSIRSRSARVLSLPALAGAPVAVEPTLLDPASGAASAIDGNEPTLNELGTEVRASTRIADLIAMPVTLGIDEFYQFDPLRRRELRRSEQTKVFTFKPDSLQIDHCRVSEISVHLQSNGAWTVSLRAEHNAADISTANTQFLRQNQFVVSLRCLGERGWTSYSVRNRPGFERRNASVITTLGPIEFFVKSGQPRTIVVNSENAYARGSIGLQAEDFMTHRDNGQTEAIARRFAQIEQIELEFFYRGRSLNVPIHRVAP